jgi:hypothetical protein
MLTKIELRHVRHIPKELQPGILYVSAEFGTAAHLCACGCGSKIRTPLGPAAWNLEETEAGPTLNPSVGNWQRPCKSHYWIRGGRVLECEEWTPEEIRAGQRAEEKRRQAYYKALDRRRGSDLQRLWRWIRSLWES